MLEEIEKVLNLQSKLKNVIDNAICVSCDTKKPMCLADKILIYINCQNGGVNPSDIIYEFNIKKSNLTFICNMLTEKEYITKNKSNVDGRAIIYLITEKGKAYINTLLQLLKNKLDKILSKEDSEKFFASINIINDLL